MYGIKIKFIKYTKCHLSLINVAQLPANFRSDCRLFMRLPIFWKQISFILQNVLYPFTFAYRVHCANFYTHKRRKINIQLLHSSRTGIELIIRAKLSKFGPNRRTHLLEKSAPTIFTSPSSILDE